MAKVDTDWQPIETAPKDGSEVLLVVKMRAGIPHKQLVGHYMRGGHCIDGHPPIGAGWYFWNGCMFDEAAEPTHWMPLPLPPKTRAEREAEIGEILGVNPRHPMIAEVVEIERGERNTDGTWKK